MSLFRRWPRGGVGHREFVPVSLAGKPGEPTRHRITAAQARIAELEALLREARAALDTTPEAHPDWVHPESLVGRIDAALSRLDTEGMTT